MNQLKGVITDIRSHEGISSVKVKASDRFIFTSVIIDSPEIFLFLQKNNEVNILFKETEVIIAKGEVNNISIQNKIPCEIASIKAGEILCQVNLLSEKIKIISIITRNAFDQLDLKKGEKVIALVKSNEVSLSAHD